MRYTVLCTSRLVACSSMSFGERRAWEAVGRRIAFATWGTTDYGDPECLSSKLSSVQLAAEQEKRGWTCFVDIPACSCLAVVTYHLASSVGQCVLYSCRHGVEGGLTHEFHLPAASSLGLPCYYQFPWMVSTSLLAALSPVSRYLLTMLPMRTYVFKRT